MTHPTPAGAFPRSKGGRGSTASVARWNHLKDESVLLPTGSGPGEKGDDANNGNFGVAIWKNEKHKNDNNI